MPAIAEQPVIGPVGRGGAHAHHGHPVNDKHHRGKDGQSQPTVGHYAVDAVGGGKAAVVLFLVARLDDLADVNISFIGDDGLGIVVQLGLHRLDIIFNVLQHALIDIERRQHLIIPFKNLDGVPPLLLLRHIMHGRLLDMRQCVLHAAGEGVLRDGFAVAGGIHGNLCGGHNAGSLQRGDLHHPAAQLPGKLLHVDLIAVLLHDVHHIDSHHHRDPQLGQLGGEVQVALQVGAVHDIEDGIGALTQQVVPGHHLLQSIRRKGIDAGQVGDGHALVLFQPAFFLFHRYAGPVAHKLVGAGQCVKKRRFSAIGVAGQCYSDIHAFLPLFLSFG